MIYLEDKSTIGVILTKFFHLCFYQIAESFENWDNILRDWAEYKIQKSLVEVRKAGRKKVKTVILSENGSQKYSSRLSRQSSKTKLTKHKITK